MTIMLCLLAAVHLSCNEMTDGTPPAMLEIETGLQPFEAEGGSQYVTVKANRAISAVPADDWCSVELASAAVDNMKVTVKSNDGEAPRSTDIIVSVAGAESAVLHVSQKGRLSTASKVIVSRKVTTAEGKSYLEVDGRPWLFSNVQAMGTQHLYGHSWGDEPYAGPMPFEWLENMFEKTAAAGYRTIGAVLTWRDVEPESQGVYDWTIVDEYIGWCEKYDLRMEIIWYGSNVVGGVRLQGHVNGWDPHIPQYLQDHDRYWGNGDNEYSPDDIHYPFLPSHDSDAADLYRWEREALHALFDHLAERDATHRTILVQLMNEPNSYKHFWEPEYRDVMNLLGGAVKDAYYVVATCINYNGVQPDEWIETLPNIDFVGIDPYVDDPELIGKYVAEMNSSLPYIAENDGKYDNMSRLMISALVHGAGAYNTWHLNNHWSDQGIYDPAAQDYTGWTVGNVPPLRQGAEATRRLLSGINKIGDVIAAAPVSMMRGFNFSGQVNCRETARIDGCDVEFVTTSGAAAIAVSSADGIYLVTDADTDTEFIFGRQPVSVSDGYNDEHGTWVETAAGSCTGTSGRYAVTVEEGACVRVRFN